MRLDYAPKFYKINISYTEQVSNSKQKLQKNFPHEKTETFPPHHQIVGCRSSTGDRYKTKEPGLGYSYLLFLPMGVKLGLSGSKAAARAFHRSIFSCFSASFSASSPAVEATAFHLLMRLAAPFRFFSIDLPDAPLLFFFLEVVVVEADGAGAGGAARTAATASLPAASASSVAATAAAAAASISAFSLAASASATAAACAEAAAEAASACAAYAAAAASSAATAAGSGGRSSKNSSGTLKSFCSSSSPENRRKRPYPGAEAVQFTQSARAAATGSATPWPSAATAAVAHSGPSSSVVM